MTNTVIIRDAEPQEAEVLSDLALRSKAHWGYSKAFMQACRDELRYTPDEIAAHDLRFRLAEAGLTIAGFSALKRLGAKAYELEALFVEPERIGTGVGRCLIQDAIATVAATCGHSLLIQGDPNAEAFYLAAGARRIGDRESASIPGRLLPLFEICIRPNQGPDLPARE